MMKVEDSKSVCYFHCVEDGNETHYDRRIHHICLICAVKLWEIAQTGIEFTMREQIIVVCNKDEFNNDLQVIKPSLN